MRILVITPYFYPHPGGSQHYIEELYSALVELKPDIKVDVICYNTEKVKKREKYKGFNIYRINSFEILRDQFSLPNYFEIISLIKKLKKNHDYQVVNAHTRFFDCSWWAPLIAKYLQAKTILTDHCAGHPVHQSWFVSTIARAADKIITPIIAKRYDEITVVSKATQKFFKNLTGIKPQIIYPGFPQRDTSKKNHSDRKLTIDKNKILISFVGRMIDSKNPSLALLAAQDITKKYPNTIFYFAGDGPLLSKLKQCGSAQIKFLGKLTHEKTQELLQRTNILIHPSYHHEGFPLTLLEAGVSDCAVIASNQGGTGEIIIHNQTGLIINPPTTINLKKALEKLITNPVMRKKLSLNLKKHVLSHYQWHKSVQQMKKILYK